MTVYDRAVTALIQAGIATGTTNSVGYFTVTFPIAFSVTPAVIATCADADATGSSSDRVFHHDPGSPTTTGFGGYVNRDGTRLNTENYEVHWFAMVPT